MQPTHHHHYLTDNRITIDYDDNCNAGDHDYIGPPCTADHAEPAPSRRHRHWVRQLRRRSLRR